jgi:fluoride exporter
MLNIALLALFGALGTLGRYAVGQGARHFFGDHFPYGTLIVNVVGCFLLGLAAQLILQTEILPRPMRIPVTVGFLGAFTTFSTFGVETMRFIRDGAWWSAASNVGLNLVLGLVAVALGVALATAKS